MVFHLWWISGQYSTTLCGEVYSKVFHDTNEDRKFQWTPFCCLQLFQSLACLRSSLPLFSEPAKSTRCNLEMVFLCGGGFNMFQPFKVLKGSPGATGCSHVNAPTTFPCRYFDTWCTARLRQDHGSRPHHWRR